MDHKAARKIVEAAFARIKGRAPTSAEAQFAQAIAWLETSYGSWDGPCAGSHNWGAVQTRGDGCPHQDSYPDGTKYTTNFMVYADETAGAADMIRHLYVLRPDVLTALDSGMGTDAAVRAMFYAHYFGSWCPNAIRQYGAAAKQSIAFTGKRATTDAGRACEAECIGNYAKAVASRIPTVAAAAGEAPTSRSVGAINPAAAPLSGSQSVLVGLGVVAGLVTLRFVKGARK